VGLREAAVTVAGLSDDEGVCFLTRPQASTVHIRAMSSPSLYTGGKTGHYYSRLTPN